MPSSGQKILKEQGIEPRNMMMWLRLEKMPTQHNCVFCKNGLFYSHFRAVAIMYGEGIQEPFLLPPISIQCQKCGTIWHLQGFNE